MKKSIQIGSAFIGVIVGAGFASGQEILQYFVSFGYMGIIGVLLAGVLFAYVGMLLFKIGSKLGATSHKGLVYGISGNFLGRIVDYVIIFTLFGIGVVMIAGGGSIFSQQFGLPSVLGSTIMAALIVSTIMLNVQKIVAIIGGVTPFLIAAVIVISIYSLFHIDLSFDELNVLAKSQPAPLPNWFLSSINYVSLALAMSASMGAVIGGSEKNEKIAARGGLIGGIGFGVILLLSYLAIFTSIDTVAGVDMPMLKIVNDVSPLLGIAMSVILFGMIFNTGVSMFFSFTARFVKMGTLKFRVTVIAVGLVAYAASFAGFTQLVNWFYPVVGYFGLFLVGAIIYSAIWGDLPERAEKKKTKTERLAESN